MTKKLLFNAYVIGSMYCASFFCEIDKQKPKAYRHALFNFWGNSHEVNTRNIHGITT